MKRKIFLGVIILELGIIIVGLLAYPTIFKLEVWAELKTTPEIGEELIIIFNQPVFRGFIKSQFSIDPVTEGEFIWLNSSSELHFIPKEEFKPALEYKITIKNIRAFALTFLIEKTFVFKTQSVLASSPRSEDKAQKLPLSEVISFQKSSGEIVNVNQPRISEGKYVDIDLSKMILTVFSNSIPLVTYEVGATGNPKTFPTPTGNFKTLSKQENHFSRKTNVWMPWSVQFHGDYFIHEIPYWPDGQRIDSRYSGGCIRLSIGSAKLFYDWIEIGTPIDVHL